MAANSVRAAIGAPSRVPGPEAWGGDPRHPLWRELEYFPTPPWAARAGGELVRSIDPKARTAWDPACGAGHMVGGLSSCGFRRLFWSDVYPHHAAPETVPEHDFLGCSPPPFGAVDWIITNPPFARAADFARRGLELARRGVAQLMRLAFLESEGRHALLYGEPHPVTVVAPFSERVPMQLGSWDPEGSTMMPYAWFVWLKGASGPAQLRSIPPGTRARLTSARDAEQWGGR